MRHASNLDEAYLQGWQGDVDYTVTFDNLTVTEVPEPATLLMAGIGGMVLMSRRTAKWALGAEDEASVSAA